LGKAEDANQVGQMNGYVHVHSLSLVEFASGFQNVAVRQIL
jgi:hypothetical protein